jgi:maltooligosyltrehalose trehalohydrolase
LTWAALYRELLQIRHREIIPRLEGIKGCCGSYEILSEGAVSVQWTLGDGSFLRPIANLGNRRMANISLSGRLLWPREIHSDNSLEPWGIMWSLAGGPDGGRLV